jgi:hypothetical protein
VPTRHEQLDNNQSDRLSESESADTNSAQREPEHPILGLQQTVGNRAVQRLIQAKSISGSSADSHGQMAARRAISSVGGPGIQRKCACGGVAGPSGECEACREKRLTQGAGSVSASSPNPMFKRDGGEVPRVDPGTVEAGLRSPGQPLDSSTRARMESRFGQDLSAGLTTANTAATSGYAVGSGSSTDQLENDADEFAARALQEPRTPGGERYDFSHVRVHTNREAAASAQALNAHAYTAGSDVVFGEGEYSPDTERGARLLAHELTHVVQQDGMAQARLVQRDGMGDVHLAEACADLVDKIRATAAFRALTGDDRKLAEEILTEISKRPRAEQYHFLILLKLLFDTPVKPPATISVETEASTTTAVQEEKKRLAKPVEAKRTDLEEKASSDPSRKWTAIKGKFGGGTYYVDRSSPANIVVKADILLTPKGTGTQKDVDSIKSMEDAIEKAASTKGYAVDIRFVNTASADTFKVDVDPSKWEVATNWSGGDPVGFAHELHHMFAFELDRYDYTSHASNESMEIPNRLYWFRQELKKPPNYNDPTSIMNSASHPNDDDACRVAGLDPAVCVPARVAARAAAKP